MSKGHKAQEQPWPRCEYDFHYYYGRQQCRNDASWSITRLSDMEHKYSCGDHIDCLAEGLSDLEEITPLLLRQVKEGEPRWPTSGE